MRWIKGSIGRQQVVTQLLRVAKPVRRRGEKMLSKWREGAGIELEKELCGLGLANNFTGSIYESHTQITLMDLYELSVVRRTGAQTTTAADEELWGGGGGVDVESVFTHSLARSLTDSAACQWVISGKAGEALRMGRAHS